MNNEKLYSKSEPFYILLITIFLQQEEQNNSERRFSSTVFQPSRVKIQKRKHYWGQFCASVWIMRVDYEGRGAIKTMDLQWELSSGGVISCGDPPPRGVVLPLGPGRLKMFGPSRCRGPIGTKQEKHQVQGVMGGGGIQLNLGLKQMDRIWDSL